MNDKAKIDALRAALEEAVKCLETLNTLSHFVPMFPALDNAREALALTADASEQAPSMAKATVMQELLRWNRSLPKPVIEISKEYAVASKVLELVATAAPVADTRAVAWLHTMDNTDGIKGNKPWKVLTFTKANPFGKPGRDYSKEYPVTSEPLISLTPTATADSAADAARLDHLEKFAVIAKPGQSIRAAIDAAMQPATGKGRV